tara:strand:- start:416 stop:526 length:111 start_codon:yes stop_codon:yes gene_type:complete
MHLSRVGPQRQVDQGIEPEQMDIAAHQVGKARLSDA